NHKTEKRGRAIDVAPLPAISTWFTFVDIRQYRWRWLTFFSSLVRASGGRALPRFEHRPHVGAIPRYVEDRPTLCRGIRVAACGQQHVCQAYPRVNVVRINSNRLAPLVDRFVDPTHLFQHLGQQLVSLRDSWRKTRGRGGVRQRFCEPA